MNSIDAQILDNKNGTAFTDIPFFNVNFIKNNHIKTISGVYSVKKPGDVIRATNLKYVFHFDSLGRLHSTYETQNNNGIKDTVINIYQYNAKNLLKVHWRNDAHGYTATHYHYDTLDRIIGEEIKRDIIDKDGVIKQSILLNQESMKYENYSNQTKKTVYNSYHLPYVDVFFNYNEFGYLLEKEERYKMTSSTNKNTYSYDNKGYLASIKSSSSIDGTFDEEFYFKYDEFGNMYEKLTFKNGKQTSDIQIIYNTDTKFLSSVLTRDLGTNFIHILRFSEYEYYKKQN